MVNAYEGPNAPLHTVAYTDPTTKLPVVIDSTHPLPTTVASGQSTLPVAEQAFVNSPQTAMQTAAGATGVGTYLPVAGYASAILTITGTFVGTITFQGASDAAETYVSLWGNQQGTANISTTATAPGTYVIACAGMNRILANITAWSSGTITVTGVASPVPYIPSQINALMPQLLAGENLTNNVMQVEVASSYANITTTTTTVVKSGAGRLMALVINTPVASSVITIFDNTAGSGTKIGTITLPGTLVSDGPITVPLFGGNFGTGLTIVTATAASDITVWFK